MSKKPNVVLVHGAWADGSCWSPVIESLQATHAHLIVDEEKFGWLPEPDFVSHFASDVNPIKARVLCAVQQGLSMSTLKTSWMFWHGSRTRRGTSWPPTTRSSRSGPSLPSTPIRGATGFDSENSKNYPAYAGH